MKTVSVIGAGFAGLTVSLRLAQKGFKVHLYEASSNVGGLLGTDITEHGLAERAANTFIRNASSERFFSELNITPTPVLKFSKKRFIYRERPQRWPPSLIETAA
ncbi:MAG TPA: NAD(P)-binding protein, partial [Bdellovibrio sp.]|nr:NAD(P)-binding protein [Bdellovibrio sp.]